MNTTILFKTDKKVKEAAMKKASQEGLTLTAILNGALKIYINQGAPENEDALARDIAKAMAQYRAGKSFSEAEIRRQLES